MQRSDVTRNDGTWVGLSLDVQDRQQPGLCVFSAGTRLLISQLSRPVLLAVVEEQLGGVDFWRTDAYRSVVPPLRVDVARALAGSPQRWAHRFAQYLIDSPDSPLHEGRWLLSCESRSGAGATPTLRMPSTGVRCSSTVIRTDTSTGSSILGRGRSFRCGRCPMPTTAGSRHSASRPVKARSHPSCCGGSVAWTVI